jgi:radical SAM protein (TIGR01212 family)
MQPEWTSEIVRERHYFPISEYYKEKFGEKVYKVSVTTASTCPNRLGLGGMQTCVFCDEWGSAAYHQQAGLELSLQIAKHKEAIRKRYKANKFLVYFQAYTTTFGRLSELKRQVESALSFEDVIGVVIGTRPDCLPKGVISFIRDLSSKTYVSVELGVQTLNDQQLEFLRRGHKQQSTDAALDRLKQLPSVDVGVHLIFGLPGETFGQLKLTAEYLNQMNVSSVKLHNLHVLKNTELEQLYHEKKFEPISLEEYSTKVGYFLSYLSQNISVHRLHAVSPRWDELVAPAWTKEKMRPTQHIIDSMVKKQLQQGCAIQQKERIGA